ncbi:glycogen-binding domain-containing protein [Roseisolibacter agri]|uniref:AMP-activated protein kinase glycogen-binding domain-containing protein n=1 Tax=Roseisolibacter agri TaxID=2014610 RepID=A0AA37V3Q3_9BACT|nr:glycogen-binding domain-containing protein [Roseisolibacter agri]GLC27027.1 hypothetical protein rosag_35400 [Roseisolibacter agri]
MATALALSASDAGAQLVHRVSVDAGGATLDQANVARVTAPTLAAGWRLAGEGAALDFSGAATLASSDRWAAQGVLAGAWTPGRTRAWELGGVATGLRYRGGAPAAHLLGLARRRLDGERWGGWGAWVGAGGGFLSREGLQAPIAAADGGVWWHGRGPTLSLALAAQRARLDSTIPAPTTGGAPYGIVVAAPVGLNAAPPALAAVAPAVRPLLAVDLTAAVEWRGRRGELALSSGLRRAPAQFDGVRGIALASGVWWALPRVGVVASAGDQMADPLRGMPAVRHLSLGLRWRVAPGRDDRAVAAPPSPAPVATADAPLAEAVEGPGETRRLRVRAPGAQRVEVRGDWTDWRPVALVRDGDAWTVPESVPRGTRRLTVRVDGGAWRVPANLAGADDDFGSRVGLLVVP